MAIVPQEFIPQFQLKKQRAKAGWEPVPPSGGPRFMAGS